MIEKEKKREIYEFCINKSSKITIGPPDKSSRRFRRSTGEMIKRYLSNCLFDKVETEPEQGLQWEG